MRRIATLTLLLLASCWDPRPAPTLSGELCDNGTDDDEDGAADCDDPDCSAACGGQTGPLERDCSDFFDEDEDGLVDCEDPDCDDSCGEADCENDVDDDEDGDVDCADDDCTGEAGCG